MKENRKGKKNPGDDSNTYYPLTHLFMAFLNEVSPLLSPSLLSSTPVDRRPALLVALGVAPVWRPEGNKNEDNWRKKRGEMRENMAAKNM